MSSEQASISQCFSCDARFSNVEEFWDHIYNVDCGSGRVEPSVPLTPVPAPPEPPSTGPPYIKTPLSESKAINDQESYACGLCEIRFNTSSDMYEHTRQSAHREKVHAMANRYAAATAPKGSNAIKSVSLNTTPSAPLYCNECQVPLSSIAAMESHITGKKHQKMIAKLNGENPVVSSTPQKPVLRDDTLPSAPEQDTEKQSFFCEYCKMTLFDRESLDRHLLSGKHLVNMAKSNAQRESSAVTISDQQTHTRQSDPMSQALLSCVNDGLDRSEINCLLRRLCLTQLLFLLYRFDESETGDQVVPIQPPKLSISGVDGQELLRVIREICREELQHLLPSNGP